jgi:hypothetical protein
VKRLKHAINVALGQAVLVAAQKVNTKLLKTDHTSL